MMLRQLLVVLLQRQVYWQYYSSAEKVMCYVFAFVGLSVSTQQDNSKGVMKFFEGVGCAVAAKD